ncbi:MAG: hypothetical protein JW717_08045 [Marinilabiliaceae bacterium]|nr:hypothetical protein [Marinilabiliaceae bacterium]
MDFAQSAIEEIRNHYRVAGYRLHNQDELEINFLGDYKDLIIPLSPQMNPDNILTVFYYYIANYGGK